MLENLFSIDFKTQIGLTQDANHDFFGIIIDIDVERTLKLQCRVNWTKLHTIVPSQLNKYIEIRICVELKYSNKFILNALLKVCSNIKWDNIHNKTICF